MADKKLLAGAATTVITPPLDISLCGSMQARQAVNIHDELHARCLALDDGDTRIALVVLDLIAADKGWLDLIKHEVHNHTSMPLENILISCTHTHSGPTPISVFQSTAEIDYLRRAGPRIADAVRMALHRLQPARVGWAVGKEDRVVFNRRFYMKPGVPLPSPFPGIEDKVKMNPGIENPAIDRPAGPTDPDVAILAVQKADDAAGQPLAIFASYALHYVGGGSSSDVSADYFGMVCDKLAELTGGPRSDPKQPFVGILANGCFGDINNIDVRKRQPQPYPYHQMNVVADMVARTIFDTWRTIKYHDWVPLKVREKSIELAVRKPTEAEVKQAKELLARAPQGPLQTLPMLYAAETVQMADWPDRFETTIQAIRIGDLAICGLPGEPFCQTGLDIKAASPFKPTMMIGMANDYAGYIPTEEQMALGGYETWRAKSSFLEAKAATKMQQTALELLNELTG